MSARGQRLRTHAGARHFLHLRLRLHLRPQGSAAAGRRACLRMGPAPADGGAADVAQESWVEWEERVLRPAAYGGDAAALAVAVQRLVRARGRRSPRPVCAPCVGNLLGRLVLGLKVPWG